MRRPGDPKWFLALGLRWRVTRVVARYPGAGGDVVRVRAVPFSDAAAARSVGPAVFDLVEGVDGWVLAT